MMPLLVISALAGLCFGTFLLVSAGHSLADSLACMALGALIVGGVLFTIRKRIPK